MYYTVLMKLSSYAKRIGISYNSAWSMWKRGQIPGYQLPTGTAHSSIRQNCARRLYAQWLCMPVYRVARTRTTWRGKPSG